MEYLIGFFLGATLMVVFYKIIMKNNFVSEQAVRVRYSQSHILGILKPLGLIPYMAKREPRKTQSSDYEKSQTVKVVMVDGQAYWIKDNVFYTADIDDNYLIRKESTRRVDTMHMDKVQLEKIMIIVDKLTEGDSHDDRSSGNTQL